MFTGIIESIGTITNIEHEGSNIHFSIASSISDELKVDQSLAHEGVCLTVVGTGGGVHRVTAVAETLDRSNLGNWGAGSKLNLERAMRADGRLDGHIVQGHVDGLGHCVEVRERAGSWQISFAYAPSPEHLLVDKGSICINGVSLTVVNPTADRFSVAIIPYTFAHTTFQYLKAGDAVNLEFDIIGKYIAKQAAPYFQQPRKYF
jgi:riboflavin synthase